MVDQTIARIACSLIVVVSVVATAPIDATADSKEEVRAANARFYEALNEMFSGNLALMKEVWSHAADVTYMGPGGDYRVGWEEVLSSWEEQASMRLGGEVNPDRTQVVVGKELAVTHGVERGENTSAQGKPEPVSIRATNVFRYEEGEWKMIGHHTDLLPFLEGDGPAD